MKLSEDSPGNWGITEPGSDDTLTRLTLALDVMGGDFGPSVTVPAALQALNSNSQLTLLLVGDPDAITPLLATADFEQRSRHYSPKLTSNNVRVCRLFLRSQLLPVMRDPRRLSAAVAEAQCAWRWSL